MKASQILLFKTTKFNRSKRPLSSSSSRPGNHGSWTCFCISGVIWALFLFSIILSHFVDFFHNFQALAIHNHFFHLNLLYDAIRFSFFRLWQLTIMFVHLSLVFDASIISLFKFWPFKIFFFILFLVSIPSLAIHS